jgi:hypothetical protein
MAKRKVKQYAFAAAVRGPHVMSMIRKIMPP